MTIMKKLLSFIVLLAISSTLSFGQIFNVNLSTKKLIKADEKQTLEQYFGKSVASNSKAAVLTEGFEGTTFPPTGWVKQNLTTNTSLQWMTSTYSHSGTKAAQVNSDSPGTTLRNEWLISPAMNLTTITNPCLIFYIGMSYHFSTTIGSNDLQVKVSTDGGTTWVANNLWSEDSVGGEFDDWTYFKRWMNLAGYASSTNFKIAFQYVGRTGLGAQAAVYLDDISVEETPANNLSVDRITLHDGYTQIPSGLGLPMYYDADFSNYGALTQTNIKLHGVVIGTGIDSTSIDTMLAPGKHITNWDVENYFFTPPTALGTYKVTSYLSSTAIPRLSLDTFDIKVVCDTCMYSRDNNKYTGYTWAGTTNNLCDPYTAANRYQVNADRMAWGVNCVLGGRSKPGSKIKAVLYKYFKENGQRTIVAQSANYYITAADIPPHALAVNPVSVSLPFVVGTTLTGYLMQPDSLYWVGIQVYGGLDSVGIAIDDSGIPQWEQTSLYFDPATSTWYIWGSGNVDAVMIRTIFNKNVFQGISEVNNNITLFSCMPNPANNSTQISYELKNNEKASIIITDIMGRIIQTLDQGAQAKGNYAVTIDLSNLTSGTYFYTLKTLIAQATDKLIIVKR